MRVVRRVHIRRLSRAAALAVCVAAASAAVAQEQRLHIEVSLSERHAHLVLDGAIIRTEPVAIGQEEWPTPTGEWRIYQIDWHPDWLPPDEEWAEDFEYTPPGHPDNPMGLVRMIFDPPYSIHGTEAYGSLGRAASHGSIRMGNDAIVHVARIVMAHGRAGRKDWWFRYVRAHPEQMVRLLILDPVPISVRE